MSTTRMMVVSLLITSAAYAANRPSELEVNFNEFHLVKTDNRSPSTERYVMVRITPKKKSSNIPGIDLSEASIVEAQHLLHPEPSDVAYSAWWASHSTRTLENGFVQSQSETTITAAAAKLLFDKMKTQFEKQSQK